MIANPWAFMLLIFFYISVTLELTRANSCYSHIVGIWDFFLSLSLSLRTGVTDDEWLDFVAGHDVRGMFTTILTGAVVLKYVTATYDDRGYKTGVQCGCFLLSVAIANLCNSRSM